MAVPKIIYNAGAGNVTVTFSRGPQGFQAWPKAVGHTNVATSGLTESVQERVEIHVSFNMQHVRIDDDYVAWSAFIAWALPGGQFKFYPDSTQATYYNCVMEGDEAQFPWKAPRVYSGAFHFRILPDSAAPSNAGEVMRKYYGYTS